MLGMKKDLFLKQISIGKVTTCSSIKGMGYIKTSLETVSILIRDHGVKSVCDLGAQNNYTVSYLPAPYMSVWFEKYNIDYMSIDLSGENNSKQFDLCQPVKTNRKFDLVTDCGTLEHVKDLYMGFWNADKLTKVGGFILHENPRTKNWPNHCHHYMDEKFHVDFAIQSGYHIIELKNTVSAHNYETGNNVFCLYQKKKEGFIEREQFPKAYTE